MDATTPLLRDQQGLPMPIGYAQVQDHPIFLRACHSPWAWLNQNVLTYIRCFLVLYLTAVGAMLIDFKINREDGHNAWRLLWQFSSLSFALLWLYHVIVFCWTFTHLHYPDIDANDRRFESIMLRGMSPPQQTANSRRRFYFSVFYTAAHVLCFMNTLIYWTVLVPQGHGHWPHQDPPVGYPDDFFADGWFKPFCIFNLWAVTALVAVIEIFFLNSIKRQVPVPSHVFGLMFLCSCYLGWAAFGRMLTGHSPFFWMDPNVVGSREVVAAYCAGFVFLGAGMFSFMYGLIGMRENLTKKDSQGSQGNQRQYIQQ